MARSPEDCTVEVRASLETHTQTLHRLAQQAVDKAFAVAPQQVGTDGKPREDTRSLTEIGD